MAADNLWWSVWWPWLAVWLGTAIALSLAALILVVQWRGQRKRKKQLPAVSFYLHAQSVMDLYQFRYRGALEQEVESTVGGRSRVGADAGAASVHFGGSVERNREEFRRYLEKSEPITVIGILMEVLEDDIIQVDLERSSIVPGRHVDIRQRRIRLSELGGRTYVLARGGFELSGSPTATTTTFLARYGDRAAVNVDVDLEPMIQVRCANGGLRGAVPDGKFWARCLGTVEGWDRVTGHLVIDPIAIFR